MTVDRLLVLLLAAFLALALVDATACARGWWVSPLCGPLVVGR